MISTGAVTVVFAVLLVGELGAASPGEVAAIEIPFSTRAGDGASGVRRIFRNGCYQVSAEGKSGAGRDSQAGCHLPGTVSEVFGRLDVLASATTGAIVKENQGSSGGGRGAQVRTVLVRGDGSRWVASNDDVAGELLSAINGMPAENQWHARPPAKPAGKGPQFVAVSVSTTGGAGPRKLQASLSVDGRWWCHRGGGGGDAAGARAGKLTPVNPREASGRLGRILQGARPKGANDDDEDPGDAGGVETSVELVFAGRSRSALFPKRLAKTVAKRFATEMSRQSTVCGLP